MRTLIIAAVVVLLVPVVAQAQTYGQIMLYADQSGTDCMLQDTEPGLVFVHVVAEGETGINAVHFAAPVPDCWTGTSWLGDNWQFYAASGSSQHGMSIRFSNEADCDSLIQVSEIYLGYILIGTQGLAPPCCAYQVVPALDWWRIEGIFCWDQDNVYEMAGGTAIINGDGSCHCMLPIPVETSTWGRVKSLYE